MKIIFHGEVRLRGQQTSLADEEAGRDGNI